MKSSRPSAGETDEEIVAGAWDFAVINRLYAEYLGLVAECPHRPIRGEKDAKIIRAWAGRERLAWLEAVSKDPLLPERLLPPNYLGREAWNARKKMMRAVAGFIRSSVLH